jgi:hypothetical protein
MERIMTREVERNVTKDADGNRIMAKAVHIDQPHKTIDKEVVQETHAETGVGVVGRRFGFD